MEYRSHGWSNFQLARSCGGAAEIVMNGGHGTAGMITHRHYAISWSGPGVMAGQGEEGKGMQGGE